VSCKHADITGAMFASPSTFVCSFCEADSLRAQLATVSTERDRLLIDNHRLRELVQVVDVNHVRVRDGLRRACDQLAASRSSCHMCDREGREAEANEVLVAELRRLVQP
jgi:hypothetical protein